MNSPNPVQADAQKVVIAVDKVVAWYKSKPLYAGGVIGLIVGLILEHFLKV